MNEKSKTIQEQITLFKSTSADQEQKFKKLYHKFKESDRWILDHPNEFNEDLLNRFFTKIVQPLEEAWEQLGSITQGRLMKKGVV